MNLTAKRFLLPVLLCISPMAFAGTVSFPSGFWGPCHSTGEFAWTTPSSTPCHTGHRAWIAFSRAIGPCQPDESCPTDLNCAGETTWEDWQKYVNLHTLHCGQPPVIGDLTEDGKVDVEDMIQLMTQWDDCDGLCLADLNNDGVVDVLDLLILLSHWTE